MSCQLCSGVLKLKEQMPFKLGYTADQINSIKPDQDKLRDREISLTQSTRKFGIVYLARHRSDFLPESF